MLKLAHARAVAVLTPMWVVGCSWLAPRMASATTVQQSYDQGVLAFNWLALLLAAGTGLWGGVLMLIIALATDKRVVKEVLGEGLRNAICAPVTGMGAYFVIEALRWRPGWDTPFEVAFGLITVAGMAAVPLVGFLFGTAREGAPKVRDGLIGIIVSNLQRFQSKPPGGPTQ